MQTGPGHHSEVGKVSRRRCEVKSADIEASHNELSTFPGTLPTNQYTVAWGLIHHLCCGFAVLIPFVRIAAEGRFSGAIPAAMFPAYFGMIMTSLLIGSGMSFPMHFRISRVLGSINAVRVGLCFTATGILFSAFGPVPWGLLAGGMLAGLGSFGEWTPSAELTRRALSSSQLRTGMRLHSWTLLAGGLLAVVLAGTGFRPDLVWSSICAVTLCALTAACIRSQPARRDHQATPVPSQPNTSHSQPPPALDQSVSPPERSEAVSYTHLRAHET